MASRYGAIVHRLDKPWGEIFSPLEIDVALHRYKVKVVAFVHVETSTGSLTPIEGMAEVVHKHAGLLLIDCITSLGGLPMKIDAWDIDIAYSGTQRCLSCPPGLAPITIGPRAQEALRQQKTKVVK